MVRLGASESRSASALSTASRISFTPPNTALMDKNWASKASAIKRAMVVLPTPGGPQSKQLCGCPDSKATRSAMPSPKMCCWPITSARVRGLSLSAKGVWLPVGLFMARCSGPHHIRALGRHKVELRSRQLAGVDVHFVKPHLRSGAKRIHNVQMRQHHLPIF